MIDEKKLIENIREKISPEKFGERCNALDVIYGVLQVIDEQPKVGEWISVDKDVPHSGKENELYDIVRVQFDDGTLGLGVYRERDDDKWWARRDEGVDMSYSTDKNVVAWQPLPDPWEGE